MEKRWIRKISILNALLIAAAILSACNNGTDKMQDTKVPDDVTFTEHIAPLLNQHCYGCHRSGGAGHFPLSNFEEAKAHGKANAYVTRNRLMPPWPADPHYTQFVGQRILTEAEIQTFEKWAATGMAEGPKEKLPPLPLPKVYNELGTPDLTLAVQPVFLTANEGDKFLLVKVPFELPNDTFAGVIEFVAGRHNVVHHVNGDMVRYRFDAKADVMAGEKVANMVSDTTIRHAFEKLKLPNDDGTYPALQKSVVNYLPGVFALRYPEGIGGYSLPRKGAFIFNDLHYGNPVKDVWDSSYINLYFTKTPPRRPVQEFQLGTLGVTPVLPNLVIEPNTIKLVHSAYKVPATISILTINPHMHLIGKSFKAYALPPDGGDTIRLISIPAWDFNWQYFYTFKKMVKIPAGSTIIAEGVYDNTVNNPNNPYNPPRQVRDRDGSMRATDEMFQFIVTYIPYQVGDENIVLGQ